MLSKAHICPCKLTNTFNLLILKCFKSLIQLCIQTFTISTICCIANSCEIRQIKNLKFVAEDINNYRQAFKMHYRQSSNLRKAQLAGNMIRISRNCKVCSSLINKISLNTKMSAEITLKRWVVLNRKQKGLQGQIKLSDQILFDDFSSLIAITVLSRQYLYLIASFAIPEEKQDEVTVVYISEQTIRIGSRNFKVAYIPASKADQEVFYCFCDLLRELADIVISDINSANVHRLKEKQTIDNKHFVLSGGKDIYEVTVKQSTLQLVKNIETPFLNSLTNLQAYESNTKTVHWGVLVESIKKYLSQWQWQLISDKNWSLLAIFVFEEYKCKEWLNLQCDGYKKISQDCKMLSNLELQCLFQELNSIRKFTKSSSDLVFRSIVQSNKAEVRKMNKKNAYYLISQLKKQLINSTIQTKNQLQDKKACLEKDFALFDLESQMIDLIILPKELELQKQLVEDLQLKNYNLQQQLLKFQKTITNKDSTIMQYDQKLKLYQEKLRQFQDLQNSKKELTQYLQNETIRNQQLSLQLQSHILLERKSLRSKVELQNKILEQKREKEGLLQCLHELTQQNLSLLTQKEEMQLTTKQLKQSLQQTNQMQFRALRCIQNEAQIKTRLYRYQKYVSELKLSMKSFKKLQSQKFNYILANNYKQYELLKTKYSEVCLALKKQENHSKILNETLQRERIRLNYFEKLLISNYQHQSIPECSEQNSSTDRQIQQIPVQ